MPSLRAVLMMRQAISPRLAIRIFLNMRAPTEQGRTRAERLLILDGTAREGRPRRRMIGKIARHGRGNAKARVVDGVAAGACPDFRRQIGAMRNATNGYNTFQMLLGAKAFWSPCSALSREERQRPS